MRRALACRCGVGVFGVRVRATEGAGLATCLDGHHSLLLDSRDVWDDCIQEGRPPVVRCRCKETCFALYVDYELRNEESVRAVSVSGVCSACGRERRLFQADIDYEPSMGLVHHPLDPIEDPWLKARRIEISALWTRADLERLLDFVGTIAGSHVQVAPWRKPFAEVSAADAGRQILSSQVEVYKLAFSCEPVTIPDGGEPWRKLPIVYVGSPMTIQYSTGVATMYFLVWAIEDIVDGVARPRSAPFLAFVETIRSYLAREHVSHRGKHTADNPAEYARLKGGW